MRHVQITTCPASQMSLRVGRRLLREKEARLCQRHRWRGFLFSQNHNIYTRCTFLIDELPPSCPCLCFSWNSYRGDAGNRAPAHCSGLHCQEEARTGEEHKDQHAQYAVHAQYAIRVWCVEIQVRSDADGFYWQTSSTRSKKDRGAKNSLCIVLLMCEG